MKKTPFDLWGEEWGLEAVPNIRGALADAFYGGVAAAAKTMGGTPETCSRCGAPMWKFLHSKTGNPGVLSREGCSHFADCPEADKFRKRSLLLLRM